MSIFLRAERETGAELPCRFLERGLCCFLAIDWKWPWCLAACKDPRGPQGPDPAAVFLQSFDSIVTTDHCTASLKRFFPNLKI